MNAALQRRLAQIEEQLAVLAPTPPGLDEALAWTAWTSDADLEWLEQLAWRMAYQDHEPTPAEQARWLSIEAAALHAMLEGEPDGITKHKLELEADVLEQRRQGKALWLGFDPRTDPVYEG